MIPPYESRWTGLVRAALSEGRLIIDQSSRQANPQDRCALNEKELGISKNRRKRPECKADGAQRPRHAK